MKKQNPIDNITIISKSIYSNIFDIILFLFENKIVDTKNSNFCIITSKNDFEYFINKLLLNKINYKIIDFKNLSKKEIKKCDCIIFYEIDYLLFYYKQQINLNLLKNILKENNKKTTVIVFNYPFISINKNLNLLLNILNYQTLSYLKSKLLPLRNENNFEIYTNLNEIQQKSILSYNNSFISYLKILQITNNPLAFDNIAFENKRENTVSPKIKKLIFDVINLYYANKKIYIFSMYLENGLNIIDNLLIANKIHDNKKIILTKLNKEEILNKDIEIADYYLFLEARHIYNKEIKNQIPKNSKIVKYYCVFNDDNLNKAYNLI